MADGFLGRWSSRKLGARQGKPTEEPAKPVPSSPQPFPASGKEGGIATVPSPAQAGGDPATDAQPVAEPPPTLDDVRSLTPESDFSRFVRAGVPADVRNSALKKLFADPRFNVQDGLDIYIDDYGKPDPIPEAMLRKMAGAKLLGLFRDEERADEAAAQPQGQPRDDAEGDAAPAVAQSGPAADGHAHDLSPAVPDDAHPDLRLQQDDAAEGGESGRGPR